MSKFSKEELKEKASKILKKVKPKVNPKVKSYAVAGLMMLTAGEAMAQNEHVDEVKSNTVENTGKELNSFNTGNSAVDSLFSETIEILDNSGLSVGNRTIALYAACKMATAKKSALGHKVTEEDMAKDIRNFVKNTVNNPERMEKLRKNYTEDKDRAENLILFHDRFEVFAHHAAKSSEEIGWRDAMDLARETVGKQKLYDRNDVAQSRHNEVAQSRDHIISEGGAIAKAKDIDRAISLMKTLAKERGGK